MSHRLRELAGNVLVVGLPGLDLTREDVRRLEDVRPAGVILFGRNLADERQAARLVSRIRSVLDEPLVMVDQEGGRVDRLRPWRGRRPPARDIAAGGAAAVREEAERTARDLAALGFDFNCAPVVDLDERNEANGLGDRAYGSDPHVVAALAREVLSAHARAGVIACLKHFPGLGRTGEDTHLSRPSVPLSAKDLMARELVPFRLLADEAPAVMVSHAAFPAVTGSDEPASLSAAIVEGLLRREIGYDGLAVTDDLDMGALSDVPAPRRALEALRAGCDLALLCQDCESPVASRDAIVQAVLDGSLADERIVEAERRVRRAKASRRVLPGA